MEHLTPIPLREAETRIFALCADHMTAEEKLLTDMLHSLRQVRDAFFQRNLKILPTLQTKQKQLTHAATEMAAARDRLRAALADHLGISEHEATLRTVAMSLPGPARSQLLQCRDRLSELMDEADQLSRQNADLLGYARGFMACLFAALPGSSTSERYGPQGERSSGTIGPLLEARV